MLQFDQSINNGEHDNVEKLNPNAEVLHFSLNRFKDNKSIESVSSAPVFTKKDDVLAVVGDGSINRLA